MDRPHDNNGCDAKMELLRASHEQVKARVAVDVLRFTNADTDDDDQGTILRRRATDFLLGYFGPPVTPTDDY